MTFQVVRDFFKDAEVDVWADCALVVEDHALNRADRSLGDVDDQGLEGGIITAAVSKPNSKSKQ